MKNIIFMLLSTVLLSCDPQYDTSFILKNTTSVTIKIVLYSASNDSILIKPDNEYLLLHDSGISGGPSKLSLEDRDSISVRKNDKSLIFYRDNSNMNQIYNMDNWTEKMTSKHNYKYTYVIDNELFD